MPFLVVRVVFVWYIRNPSYIPNLKSLLSAVVEIRVPKFLGCSLAQIVDVGPKSCFWQRCFMTPSCVPNLKLLSSAVVEMSRGSQNFWGAPLSQTPVNFGPESCFWQHYSMTPSYIPILKSLAKIVSEISRGSHNLGMLPWPNPCQFCFKSCFWHATSQTEVVYQIWSYYHQRL